MRTIVGKGNNEFFHLGSEGVRVFQTSLGDVHSLRKRLIRKCQPCVCVLCVQNNNSFDVNMTAHFLLAAFRPTKRHAIN